VCSSDLIVNNSEFHKCQLNESRDFVEGKEIKSSVMINIRCDDPTELISLYREVKAKLGSEEKAQNGKKQKENNSNGEKVPICGCGLPMALRQNRKQNSWFWSCQKWTKQGGGCGMTFPWAESKEEVIELERIPF
jgi:hypothetical protein